MEFRRTNEDRDQECNFVKVAALNWINKSIGSDWRPDGEINLAAGLGIKTFLCGEEFG